MSYEIGDKVLCVNDKNWRFPIENTPVCGEVYTIREVQIFPDYDNVVGILLEEITNSKRPFKNGDGRIVLNEPAFMIIRFIKWNPEAEEIEMEAEHVGIQLQEI